MRLAYFSPLNPIKSGISDYSEELLPHLSKYASIDIFIDGYTPTNKEITDNFPVYSKSSFENLRRQRKYDTQIYHVGNNPYHAYIYKTLCKYSGIAVVHDYFLHHYIATATLGTDSPEGYIKEMGFSHGVEGVLAAVNAIGINQYPVTKYPVNGRVLESSLGVIVHNNYMFNKIKEERPWINVVRVNHHAFPLNLPSSKDAKEILSLDENPLVIGSFGFVTPEKRLDVALKAFKKVREKLPSATYVIVGEVSNSYPFQSMVDELDLRQAVRLIGRAEMPMFQLYMAASDICVNLRYPTMGETSGSLLRILGAGRPAIVSNVGSFAELPDDCCRKIDVGESEESSLVSTILDLAGDSEQRENLGNKARKYIESEHNIEKSASDYISYVETVLAAI